MLTYSLVGGAIIVIMSMMTDMGETVNLVVAVITIRGITWICKRIVQSINKDAGDMINFAGWGIAGVSIVGILKNAIHSPLIQSLSKTSETIQVIIGSMDKFANWIDKIAFWN